MEGSVAIQCPVLDKALLAPSSIRFLLGRYQRCIKAHFDILSADILSHDGLNVKKLPAAQGFQVLMACAIAATRESYRAPNWKVFAHSCRSWANDLIIPIVSPANMESLRAIMLLIIFEMADPSRGIIWDLLDLAIRTCIQLGWHRPAHIGSLTSNYGSTATSPIDGNLPDANLILALETVKW